MFFSARFLSARFLSAMFLSAVFLRAVIPPVVPLKTMSLGNGHANLRLSRQ